MALDPLIQQKLSEMVKRIRQNFDPEKIILFGSHARGTAHPGSDVDLLVIKKGVQSRRAMRIAIREKLNGMGISKDIIVVTPEEVAKYANAIGTIIQPAVKYGVTLYEKRS